MKSTPTGDRVTPIYDAQRALGARFTSFHGWSLPVTYSTLTDEHHAVRKACGLFDVSHMGEIFVTGPKALEFLQYVTTNDVSRLTPGQAHYSLLLNDGGGVVDDIIVYCFSPERYLLCVNAGNADKDWAWLNAHNPQRATLENCSDQFAQIALQGPRARDILGAILQVNPATLTVAAFPAFTFREIALPGIAGEKAIVACTGYTGEDGFEFFIRNAQATPLWNMLLEKGAPFGIKPAGLGARDTLRLEACMCLHGHELRDDLSALCCGIGGTIKWEKGDFIGKGALERVRAAGVPSKVVGLKVLEPGIIREGAQLYLPGEDSAIGWVSSGTKPPTVDAAVGIGFVKPELSDLGTRLEAEVRGRRLAVEVIKRPFYKRPAA